MSEPIKNRYEFVVLFDVETATRMRPRTPGTCPRWTGDRLGPGHRRMPQAEDPQLRGDRQGGPYRLAHHVKDGVPLNRSDARGLCCAWTGNGKDREGQKKADPELDAKVRDWMCPKFYDIRTLRRDDHL